MALETWLKSEVEYGGELVRCAVAGARTAGEPVGAVLARSARASWPWLTVGASIGLLASCLGNRRKSRAGAAVCGVLLGAAVGFSANVAFSTRQLAEDSVRGAMRNINGVRDAHWLAKHPIDYA